MLHLFGTGSAYLARLRDLVLPGGRVSIGTLTLADRSLGDRWLYALHRRGEAAVPQTRNQVLKGFEIEFVLDSQESYGNMMFMHGHRQDA